MKRKNIIEFDLTDPIQAKDFLTELTMRNKGRITRVHTKKSGWIEFKDMSDVQAIDIASAFWDDFMSLDPEQRTITAVFLINVIAKAKDRK